MDTTIINGIKIEVHYFEDGKEIDLPDYVKKMNGTEQLQWCWCMGIEIQQKVVK